MARYFIRCGLDRIELSQEEFNNYHRVGNRPHGGITEMIQTGKTPSVCMAELTHGMGLRFGQEEVYPEIRHWDSAGDY